MLNKNIEGIIKEKTKFFIEDLLNEIMYEERKEFLKRYNTCGDGFNKRSLRTTLTLDLNLRVPKVRKYSRELNYSIFEKYQRTTPEFEEIIEKLYTSRLYERDIAELLKMSSITYERKKKILEKYYKKYQDWCIERKKCSKVVKIDSTYFHSKRSKEKYSVYSVFNSYEDSTLELIYFYIQKGNENTTGWRNTINHIVKYFDLSKTVLIVSDMAKHIKNVLYETEELKHIEKQNCIWHRVMSLADCVKINKAKRAELLAQVYTNFISMKEPDYTVFDCFKEFEPRTKTIEGYKTTRSIERSVKFYNSDNYTFLKIRKELGEYQKKELIQTGNVEAYFSALKQYLRKHTNYSSKRVLASKIMMYVEKEKVGLKNKQLKKAKLVNKKRKAYQKEQEGLEKD